MKITCFNKANITPIPIKNKSTILDLFYQQGFAIIDSKALLTQNPLPVIAKELQLGENFISDYNKKYFPNKINLAEGTTQIGDNKKDVFKHSTFEGNKYLEQHVDGTMSSLAGVKTSLLWCHTEAKSGGETVLFNAYGAIKYLEKEQPNVVIPFKNPHALRRFAKYEDGSEIDKIDCVFGIDPDYQREAIRLTYDVTADWSYGFKRVPQLEESYTKLHNLYKNDTRFTLEFPLGKGNTIIMDNTRITHGRTAFIEEASMPRKMIRTTHIKLPS